MSILGGMNGRNGRGPAAAGGGGSARGTRAAEVIPVSEAEFEQEVILSELPVLIEFSAEWCAPCKQIAPEVAAFAREMAGKAKVVTIDVDKSKVIARQLRVQSVPTFMVFANQRIVDAQVGAIGKKRMTEMMEPFLPRAEGALKPREVAELIRQAR